MRKLFTLLLAVAASVGTMFASDTQVDGIWYDFDDSNQTASVTYKGSYSSYANEYSGSVTIPASVFYNNKTYNVTSIGSSAFQGCKGLTSVTIGNNITSIGENAFYGCSGLKSVTIPNSITIIRRKTFAGCSSLTYIDIPNSVKNIGERTFHNCNNLAIVMIEAEEPPTLGSEVFQGVNNYSIYVPCGALDAYKSAWDEYVLQIKYAPGWKKISTYAGQGYITITSSEDYTICDELPLDYVLTVTSDYGYHFAQWSDGNTDNPRTIELTQDTTFEAIFAHNPVITYVFDPIMGTVEGDTITPTGIAEADISFAATPNHGYHFVRWSDGNTDNPRTITLTQDTTFEAIFAQTFSGQCGDALYWEYADNQLIFSGSGAMYNYDSISVPWSLFTQQTKHINFAPEMTSISAFSFQNMVDLCKVNLPAEMQIIGASAFANCTSIKNLTIPNSVISIGSNSFYGNSSIDSLILGTGVTTITDQFYGCSGLHYLQLSQNMQEVERGAFIDAEKLNYIVCHAKYPPTAYADKGDLLRSFYNMNARVLIPCDNFEEYEVDALWGSFNLKCLSSNSGTAIDGQVTVVPGDADATFTWPTDGGANTYNLEITKDGVVFCTLTFNSQGQLQGIHFAPAINGTPRHTPSATLTTSGMTFQVTGLDYASQYRFSFETKDATKTLFAYTGGFSTTGAPQGIGNINADTKAVKRIVNGQLLIERDGKTYTLTGQEVE